MSFFIPIKYISTARSAGFTSPMALWLQQLHSDRIDILTYGLPVDDSRLGLQVSLQRLNNQSIVCPPLFLGQDARPSLAYVLCYGQFGGERALSAGKHHGYCRRASLVISSGLYGHRTSKPPSQPYG